MSVPLTPTVQRLSRIAHLAARLPGETDLDLLTAFRDRRDQAAFAELVRRHGNLVRAVCRRVLGHHPAVDDAWQATFLVLARRASALARVGSLAGWLHGVAYRTALNARRADRRRTAREGRARSADVAPPDKQAIWRELQELVDAEVRRLPGSIQEVFVRCCLEDAGCNEVAKELGLNEGTVRSRLARARRLLRGRLERRGVCLSAVVALATIATDRVPTALAGQTAAAAVRLATGETVTGLVSPHVLAMAGRTGTAVVRRIAVAVTIVAGVIGVALAQLPANPADPPPAKAPAAAEPAKAADGDPLPAGALTRFGSVRFRPGNSVHALAFSPDGKRLASWGGVMYRHDQLTLWDASTGKELRSQTTLERQLMALAWPANRPGLAVLKQGEAFAGNRTTVADFRVWDFSAEKPEDLAAPQGGPRGFGVRPPGGVSYDAAAVSDDGRRLAVVTSETGKPDGIVVFELKTAQSVTELKELAKFEAPPAGCKTIAFTPDGKQLVGVCVVEKDGKPTEAGILVVWDAAGKIARTVAAPDGASQWSNFYLGVSNATAAIGLGDGNVFVADLTAGAGRTIATAHKGGLRTAGAGVWAVAFSPDGKALASAGMDGMVRLSDVPSGTVRDLGRHYSWPQALAFTADGKRLASGGQDGVIRVWDVAAGGEAVPTGGHGEAVWQAGLSADRATVLTSSHDGVLRLWDPATGAERRRIDVGKSQTARLSPDGKHVVAIVGDWEAPDRTLKAFDGATGADATPPGFPKTLAATGFRFTPDGTTLITHHDDRLTAYAWPAGTRRWAVEMPKPKNSPGINRVDSLAVSPDGRHFATVAGRSWHREEKGLKFGYGADGVVDLFETATGKHVRRLVEAQQCFRAGTFTADGLFIHSGGGTFPGDVGGGKARETGAQLCVLDPLTGRLVREFKDPKRVDSVNTGFTVTLSADGKVLFKATGVGEVWAFEVATGTFRTAFAGHRDMVTALDTPTDVRRLLSGSKDTTALLWDVGFGRQKGTTLTPPARAQLWESLLSEDGKVGYEAMTALAGDPAGFVELASAELKPAAVGPAAADLAPIFKDLDAKAFATREAAAAKLDRHGESALALVRAELERGPSAEVRERLERFIERCDGPRTFPERLRASRAVELLEHLRTPEARAVLAKLAAGGPSRTTTDAAGAVKRLAGR
jgi:RNA polymerase sigma factor (sigma-70 family)